MNAASLIREGEALARPCVYLRDSGDGYAAVWSEAAGPRLVFDSAFLPPPAWARRGLFCLEATAGGGLTFSNEARLPAAPPGLKLYASPASSLPPLDAVLAFGGREVQAWLRELGWPPQRGYNANFPDRGPAEEYEAHYQGHLPFFSGSAHAVLGGWHFPWPDGDWLHLCSARLLAWTLAGGEPWLEGWVKDGRLWAEERIT